jgi:hypothetical protein
MNEKRDRGARLRRMSRPGRRWRGLPRAGVVLASLVYAWALHYAHVEYLNPLWDYFGFTYRVLGWREIVLVVVLVLVGSLAVPARIRGASSILIFCLFVAVYIPAVVLTLSLNTDRLPRYLPILAALAAAFTLACVASRWRVLPEIHEGRLPGRGFSYGILVAWAVCAAALLATYGSIMSLVSLGDVYEQRTAGASTSMLMGYVQTYFGYVFSPALIAIGLASRRRVLALTGTLGCLIMYMIDAQRTVFLLPAAMIALDVLLRSRFRVLRTTAFPVFGLAAVVFLSAAFYKVSGLASLISQHITFRTLSFPGLTYSLYYDLFSRDGYTWWSHVKGFNFFVPVPAAYVSDPRWPGLGYIVADRVHNMESNANANLFAGDGVAAGGALGALLIGIVFAVYVVALDYVARGWDRRFTILLLVPVGITLINGQFFTTMLSFGGIFWVLMLYFQRPRPRHPSPKAAAPAQ